MNAKYSLDAAIRASRASARISEDLLARVFGKSLAGVAEQKALNDITNARFDTLQPFIEEPGIVTEEQWAELARTEPLCTCGHLRSAHAEEMPYECFDDSAPAVSCACRAFEYPRKPKSDPFEQDREDRAAHEGMYDCQTTPDDLDEQAARDAARKDEV